MKFLRTPILKNIWERLLLHSKNFLLDISDVSKIFSTTSSNLTISNVSYKKKMKICHYYFGLLLSLWELLVKVLKRDKVVHMVLLKDTLVLPLKMVSNMAMQLSISRNSIFRRVASYELGVERLKAQVDSLKVRVQIQELGVQMHRVTSSNSRVTSSNPRVTSSNPRVQESLN